MSNRHQPPAAPSIGAPRPDVTTTVHSFAPPRRAGRLIRWVAAAAGACLLGACASTAEEASLFVHPNSDLALYERVAVMPLVNLTSDRYAGERVREVLVVELASLGMFEVAEAGEVTRALRARNVGEVTEIDPVLVAEIGRELRAQAVIVGTVLDFRERRSGSFTIPEVSLSLRMLDVESGVAVWSVSDARSGISMRTRLFGLGEKTQTAIVRELIRDLLALVLDWA